MSAQRERPFRSVAGALIFCMLCGPVGLLYASLSGGIILMTAALFVLRAKLFVLLSLIWLLSCVWGVIAAQRYNERILKHR